MIGLRPAALAALSGEAVWTVYKPSSPAGGEAVDLDLGARELMAGLVKVVAIRATIQQAIGVIMAWEAVGALDAYLSLCAREAETGGSLTATAAAVIQQLSEHRNRPNA